MSTDTDKKALPIPREEIVEAVARGWCAPECSDIEMDSRLTYAIVREIESMLAVRLGAAPASGTVEKALEKAAVICEDRAMHWQQTEGSYAAGKKAGALDCAESIRAAIEAHNARSPSCGP